MKEWFKFIGLSFYSDKTAKQAERYGVGSILLSAVVAIVFLLFGLIAAYALPSGINYANAPELKATVERAFSDDGAALEIKDGELFADRIIDTVESDADRTDFSRGYDIIVDTRKADTFDDFEAYCVTESGNEITYEKYLELDDDGKKIYTFKIRYSGRERVIDAQWIERCESYLDGVTDESTANAYAEVKKKTGDEYAAAVYDLYVRTYYPSLAAYETGGAAPKTRNYYYHNYGKRENILFVFNDSMIGLYETSLGAKHTLYGYYGKLPDGKIGTSAADIDEFMSKSRNGATAVVVYNGAIGFFSVMPFIVLAVIAVAFVLFCSVKLGKLEPMKFGTAAKTVCSFAAWSALYSAVIMFGLGCLVSQSLLAWLEGIVFFAVLLIRTVAMLIHSAVERKRENARVTDANTATEQAEQAKNSEEIGQ